jgi:hypothetical protein
VPGGRSRIQIGRERLPSPGAAAISLENGFAAVPYNGLVIVTAMFGMVWRPTLRIVITSRVRCAKRCRAGNVAWVTATGKLAGRRVRGSVVEPPHAATSAPHAIAANAAPLLDSRRLKPRAK